eukprot:3649338-Pyramimonas_sp.AAC.1
MEFVSGLPLPSVDPLEPKRELRKQRLQKNIDKANVIDGKKKNNNNSKQKLVKKAKKAKKAKLPRPPGSEPE